MSFDSLFFIVFGLFTLTMGIINKGNAFWKQFDRPNMVRNSKRHSRVINITMGVVSILIGIILYRK